MTDESRFIKKNRNIIITHSKLFGGNFCYHIPDNSLFYEDKDYQAYFIPDNIKPKELANIIKDDIAKGADSIPERFKDHIIIYDKDKIY
jgi:hypothetical protein